MLVQSDSYYSIPITFLPATRLSYPSLDASCPKISQPYRLARLPHLGAFANSVSPPSWLPVWIVPFRGLPGDF